MNTIAGWTFRQQTIGNLHQHDQHVTFIKSGQRRTFRISTDLCGIQEKLSSDKLHCGISPTLSNMNIFGWIISTIQQWHISHSVNLVQKHLIWVNVIVRQNLTVSIEGKQVSFQQIRSFVNSWVQAHSMKRNPKSEWKIAQIQDLEAQWAIKQYLWLKKKGQHKLASCQKLLFLEVRWWFSC